MSLDSSDPPRLTELASDAPSELRSLFEFARRDVPSDAMIAALATRVGPILGPPAGGSGPDLGGGAAPAGGTAAPAASGVGGAISGSAVGKVLGAAVVTSLIGGAVWVATQKSPQPPPEAAVQPTSEQPATRAAPVSTERSPNEPALALSPALDAVQDSRVVDHKPADTTARVASKPRPASSAAAEAQILERARALMKSDPARALGVVEEHARLYPKGVLAQERDVITIEALRRMGRGSEAQSRVEAFERDYPGSAHQRSIKRSPAEN